MNEHEIDEALLNLTKAGLMRAFIDKGEIWYEPTEEGIKIVELLQTNEEQ